MSSTEPEFRTQRLAEIGGIVAELGGLDQLPNWGSDTTETMSAESFEALGHHGCET